MNFLFDIPIPVVSTYFLHVNCSFLSLNVLQWLWVSFHTIKNIFENIYNNFMVNYWIDCILVIVWVFEHWWVVNISLVNQDFQIILGFFFFLIEINGHDSVITEDQRSWFQSPYLFVLDMHSKKKCFYFYNLIY